MKRTTNKPLRLSTETLRHLADAALRRVNGGAESNIAGNGTPYTCAGSCTCHD